MKILNISTILPLEHLKRDNDIILRIQDYLKIHYGYDFVMAKSLPYINNILAKRSKKWATYQQYQQKEYVNIQGYKVFLYPWLAPPTSNLWINYLLIPLNFLWFQLKLKRKFIFLTKDVDLIASQSIIPDALFAYWLSKIINKPYIVNIRNGKSLMLKFFPISAIIKNASIIITPSPKDYKKFKNKLDIQLIPHPINSIYFLQKKKSLELSPIRLISVCRLLSLKHIDWVIQALATLKDKGYKFEYHIVGDGDEYDNLKLLTKINALDSMVFFHGYLDKQQIKELLFKSHMFIMPSYPEALGIAFLEAAAAKCMVIGHKNSGVDGVLKHKHSAIFVNKHTLVNELIYVFENLSPKFLNYYTENAWKIVNEITWEKIGAIYNNIYSKQ